MSSVGEGYVAGLLEVVERLGVSRTALLAQVGLPGSAAGLWQTRLPMSEVIALFDAAVVLTGRADLGLEFGRRVRPGTFQVLGYALMTCRTLGEAIALVPHYRRLVFDRGYSEMSLRVEGEAAHLAWQVVSDRLPYCRAMAESQMAAWYSFGRWMAGVDLPLQAVHFVHAAPADTAPYRAYFECPVHFSAAQNALVFAREWLELPLVQADASLHLAMREQARAALEKTFHAEDLVQSLRQVLLPLLPHGEATLERAAQTMGLSARSLQRKLGEAGASFQQVLDAVRQDMALVYLGDPQLSALDVAQLLGYAEQSSFTRVFKGWFGSSPSQWRRLRR